MVLLLPLAQQGLSLFPTGKLYGTFLLAPDTDFSLAGWYNQEYQNAKDRYLNDNIGFRPFMIRVGNQADYSLFEKLHARKIVKGKNNCFFARQFIDSYNGKDFVGEGIIREKARMLKALQDTLAGLGKTLVLAYAADKAFYYPEFLPGQYENKPGTCTNYDAYKGIAGSAGINQVDFNSWFLALKGKRGEELYPREGIHWSAHGALLAADSMIRYIEELRHIHMFHPVWDRVVQTRTARFYDDDISKGLNLLFPATDAVFTYPEVRYEGKVDAIRPRIIFIGDSFFFPWVHEHVMDYTTTDWQLWYYFNEVWERYNQQDLPKKPISGCDWLSEVNKTDCIVIMYTPENLAKLGDGFIEQAYAWYFPSRKK